MKQINPAGWIIYGDDKRNVKIESVYSGYPNPKNIGCKITFTNGGEIITSVEITNIEAQVMISALKHMSEE